MKKTMRFLGVVFALIMVLCCVQVALAADYTLTPGTTISVTGKGYDDAIVKFIPEVSGTYKLTADSDSSFSIDYEESDNNYHFEDVNNYEAGTEYEFYVSLDNIWTKYDKIDISIALVCTHENKTVIPAKNFTCTEPGYSEKIICADCEWILKDAYTIVARHVDTDNDYVCDVCGQEAMLINGTYSEHIFDDDDDESNDEIKFTLEYKFYANGDLYLDGEGEYSLYRIDELYDYYWDLYNPVTDEQDVKFRNVYVGKGITMIGYFHGEKFIVDPENEVYSSDAYGVLFSKDGTRLLMTPYEWKEVSYDIPASVEYIDYYAFEAGEYLKTVTIPDSVKFIGSEAFNTDVLTCDETVDGLIYIGDTLIDDIGGFDYNNYEEITIDVANIREGTRIIAEGVGWYDGIVYNIPASVEIICGNLYYDASAYNVAEGNKLYSSVDGVLFNVDKTELIQYPGMSKRSSYTVPAGVKKIGDYAIDTYNLREIILPDGLEVIGVVGIYAPSVAGITLPETLKRIEEAGINIDGSSVSQYNFGIVIPESVEYIGAYSVGSKAAILNPDCYIEPNQYLVYVAGYKGSTAEAYTRTDEWAPWYEFNSISGLFHKHVEFGAVTKAPTCTEDGEVKFACPCGKNRAKTEKIAASHVFGHIIVNGKIDCEVCGEEFDESVLYPDRNCTCICNSYYENAFKTFVYKFKLFFWKLFRVNQVCECGRHLHYYITN